MDDTWYFWYDEYWPENREKVGISERHTIMKEGKDKYTKEEIEKLPNFSRWLSGVDPKMLGF